MLWKRFAFLLSTKNNWLTVSIRLEFWPASITPVFSATKILSMTNSPTLSALWQSTSKEVMSFNWSNSTKLRGKISTKAPYGKLPTKHSRVFLSFMIWIFCTEISSVPTSSSRKINRKSNWQIWMCRSWPRVVWLALKLELHTMPVLKFGKRSLTVPNATFGH